MRQSAGPARASEAPAEHRSGDLGEVLARRVGQRIRIVLAEVDRFRDLASRRGEVPALDALAQEIVHDATACFIEATILRGDDVAMNPDHAACLADLRDFAAALRGAEPPSQTDLMHALDSLIVHCAVLDAERRDPMQRWQTPDADCAARCRLT
jgi:hypothetical protein